MIDVVEVQGHSPEWDAYLITRPEASPYFAPDVAMLLQGHYGVTPVRFMARQDGIVQGVFFGYGTPGSRRRALFTSPVGLTASSQAAAMALIEAAKGWCDRHGVVVSVIGLGQGEPVSGHGYAVWQRTTLVKDLSVGEDALWNGLRKKSRHTIRQAGGKGLEVRQGHSELPAFEAFYRDRMLEKGINPQKQGFLQALAESLGHGMVVMLAYFEGRPVAGMVFLDSPGIRIYRWNAATAEGMALNANHFLMWEAIRSAVSAGIPVLDMGESVPGGGVYHFKTVQFGAEPVPVNYIDVTCAEGQERPNVRRLPLWLHGINRYRDRLPGRLREAVYTATKPYERMW